MKNIKHFSSHTELFQFVTAYFINSAKEQIAKKGNFNVAVSGGSTPLPFFRALAQLKNSLDWSKVNLFWVDERWVPMEDPQNNYGEAMRAGLNELRANFYPFDTSMKSPIISTNTYSQQVDKLLNRQNMDLTLLGAGTDGHTASIFDDDLALAKGNEIAFVTSHPQTQQIRLSLTLPTITKSGELLVIIVGEEKRMIIESLLQYVEPHSPIQFAIFNSLNSTIVTDIHV